MKLLKFQHILKPTLWGSDGIARLKGLAGMAVNIGESWEISGLAGQETPVREGEHKGATLPELIRRHGARLVGGECLRRFGTDFPLLVKFLSTSSYLSIQVHPDDDMAHRMGHPFGKAEMWYVVDAEPAATLISGFNRDFSAEKYMTALTDGTLPEYLKYSFTQRGDCFFIPPGRIHSIGGGNLIIEIQQSSDDTFRVYDFDRIDHNGRKRELHIRQAREALDYRAARDIRTLYTPRENTEVDLVACPQFTTRLLQITATYGMDLSATDSFVVLVAYEGDADIVDAKGGVTTLSAGESVLIPACCAGVSIRPAGHRFSCLTASLTP